jgi:hypothetical protein
MADVISTDPIFTHVLTTEEKNSAGAGATAFAGVFARQKRTIEIGSDFAVNVKAGTSALKYANGAMGLAIVPWGIVNKCIDISNKTDEILALDGVLKLAKVLQNPLAKRMGDTLKSNATHEAFTTAMASTLSVIGTGVSVGLAPAGVNLIPGAKITASSPSGLITQSTFSNGAYMLSKPIVEVGIKEATKPWALGNILAGCKSDFVGPIFTVRKFKKSIKDTKFYPPQDTKCYNLYDKKLVISLLAYISVPLQYPSKPNDDDGQRDYEMDMARGLLKNLMGSYFGENAVRPISIGMRPQDYISEKLGFWNANPMHGIDQDRIDLEERFKKQRPPSFVRLLCVGAGLISDVRPKEAEAKGKWKPIYSENPKTLLEGLAQNSNVWRDPEEIYFSSFKPEEKTSEGIAKSYLCRPLLADAALNDRIKENPLIKKSAVYLNYPSYAMLLRSVRMKSRWERDKENMKCSTVGCKAEAGKFITGLSHCRCCGKIYCDKHLKKSRYLSDAEIDSLELRENLISTKHILHKEEKTCDACIEFLDNYGETKSPYDRLALTEGSAIVRPMFIEDGLLKKVPHVIKKSSIIFDDPLAGSPGSYRVRFSTVIDNNDDNDDDDTIVIRVPDKDSN